MPHRYWLKKTGPFEVNLINIKTIGNSHEKTKKTTNNEKIISKIRLKS
jgi:hypothetical protein